MDSVDQLGVLSVKSNEANKNVSKPTIQTIPAVKRLETQVSPKTELKSDTFESQDKTAKKEKQKKWGKVGASLAAVGIVVAGMIFGKKKIDANKARKVAAEAQAKAVARARELAIEKQKAAEQAKIEAEILAKERAEAAEKARIRAEEARAKAKAEAEALAKRRETDHLNRSCEWNLDTCIGKEFPTSYRLKEEHTGWEYLEKLQQEGPFASIEKLPEAIKENIEKGADISPKAIAEYFEKGFLKTISKEDKSSYFSRLYDLNKYGSTSNSKIARELEKRDNMLREVVEELKASENAEGKNTYDTFKEAIAKVKNRYEAIKAARIERVKNISEQNESEVAKIKDRLVYDESFTPQSQRIQLTPEQKKAVIDTLNEEAGIHLTMDSSMYEVAEAWKRKYVGLPIKITKEAAEGERAILETFPKYDGIQRDWSGKEIRKISSEFEHAPLYRFMHVENEVEFLKQFDRIGSEYVPDTIQSCGKAKYYGEAWGPIEARRYGFTEWDKHNNVKFVIHPKGKHSSAADIGETKYGSLEAIYPAGTKFRYIGKYKKVITPEEINKAMGHDFNFEDFERYEIHLQEL